MSAGAIIRALGWLVRHSHDEEHDKDGDILREMVVNARDELDAFDAATINHRHEVAALLAEIERLKAEVVRLSVDNMKWRQRVKAKEAQEALTPEIRAAFAAIPDMDREAAAALPAALAEVERWKMHHFQVVKDNRRLRRALAAGPAALRKITDDYDGAAEIVEADGALDCAAMVEAAQEAAMKEGT